MAGPAGATDPDIYVPTPVAGNPALKAAARAEVEPPGADATDAILLPATDPLVDKRLVFKRLRRVVLDPGHGGGNLGAVGFFGVREKVLTLEVARVVAAFIEKHSNLEVRLTRHGDADIALRERPRLANRWQGDALVSIHANASPNPEVHGVEAWFLKAETSRALSRELVARDEGLSDGKRHLKMPWSVEGIVAELNFARAHAQSQHLAIALRRAARRALPDVRFRGVYQARFAVLKEATMPAVVFEIGYLTHPDEGRALLLRERQLQIARTVLLALADLDARQVDVSGEPPPGSTAAKRLARPRSGTVATR